MDLSFSAYEACELCPRMCGVNRTAGTRGVCGMSSELTVARAALHYWEEPPISGDAGSGTIFFSGCPMKCIFCQNLEISRNGFGAQIEVNRLAEMMLELEAQGALNINLVTPTHFSPHVIEAVQAAREQGLSLPIVCNTSGYERVELVSALRDVVDIWLTDFKYASSDLAARFSGTQDYPQVAQEALVEMLVSLEAKGGRKEDETGRMLQGIIVRHLVLPGHTDDSCAVLDRIWELAGNAVDLSVMNQYTPTAAVIESGDELSRPLTGDEYEIVLNHADELGFERMWWQEGGTVSESFVPEFDLTGVAKAKQQDS